MNSGLNDMYIASDLVAVDIEASTNNEALQSLASVMLSEGVVKQSFSDALITREEEFPTGLALENIGVAIPHTDSIHVERQSLAIGILKDTVEFRMMGGAEEDVVQVKIMFMLAIKDAHKQLEFLQSLMNLMQNDQQIIRLTSLKEPNEIIEEFKKIIR